MIRIDAVWLASEPLDMRAGIVYDENYAETGGPIVEYRKAMGWNPASRQQNEKADTM